MATTKNQYVEIRKNRAGEDRPFVVGTRVRVQEIVIDHERLSQSAETIAQGFDHISIAQVHGALAYFFENREFVWECIRKDEAYAASAQGHLPGPSGSAPVPLKDLSTDDPGAAIPS